MRISAKFLQNLYKISKQGKEGGARRKKNDRDEDGEKLLPDFFPHFAKKRRSEDCQTRPTIRVYGGTQFLGQVSTAINIWTKSGLGDPIRFVRWRKTQRENSSGWTERLPTRISYVSVNFPGVERSNHPFLHVKNKSMF